MAPWNKGATYKMADRQAGLGGRSVGDVVSGKELVSYAGRNQHGHHLWEWKCLTCETRSGPSTISHLGRGTRCATCCTLPGRQPNWRGYEGISGKYLSQIRMDAVKRGLAHEVEPADLWEQWLIQGGRCIYTGWSLTLNGDASLDRRDNTRGYVPGNIQWVHRDVNRMKSDFTEERFLSVCAAITRRP